MAPRVAHRRDSPAVYPVPFPPSGPLLLVSPHLDDAALSCGALLDRGEALDVLTVFTGVPDDPVLTKWDRMTGFASAAESMAARLREDRRAFQGSGHRLHHLGLLDSGYSPHPRPPTDRSEIAAAVSLWLERNPAGLVALPAGAGRNRPRRFKLDRLIGRFESGRAQHPDHVFVRDAALAAARDRELLLYEELPYSYSLRANSAVASIVAGVGARAEMRQAEVDRDLKAQRIAAYRSQLPHLCPNGRRLDTPGALPLLERYWRLTPG